ncbi:MAG: 2-oxoisovalerate dehydrogenase [Leptolyngbya sp. BL-A-14]
MTDNSKGGFITRAIGESIFTQADTIAELKPLIRNAVQCHYPDQQERPKLICLYIDEVLKD